MDTVAWTQDLLLNLSSPPPPPTKVDSEDGDGHHLAVQLLFFSGWKSG